MRCSCIRHTQGKPSSTKGRARRRTRDGEREARADKTTGGTKREACSRRRVLCMRARTQVFPSTFASPHRARATCADERFLSFHVCVSCCHSFWSHTHVPLARPCLSTKREVQRCNDVARRSEADDGTAPASRSHSRPFRAAFAERGTPHPGKVVRAWQEGTAVPLSPLFCRGQCCQPPFPVSRPTGFSMCCTMCTQNSRPSCRGRSAKAATLPCGNGDREVICLADAA